MQQSIMIYLFFISFTSLAWGQDEKLFKQMLTRIQIDDETKHSFKWSSSSYLIDINSDKIEESLSFQRRGGESWIQIKNNINNKLIYEYRFENRGVRPKLYKLDLKTLSSTARVMVLYFYEGHTSYLNKYGSSRFYFLTLDNGKLDTLKMFKGPRFWQEDHERRHLYRRRSSYYSLKDLDGDGIQEIIVKSKSINRVYQYLANGNWKQI